MIYSLTRKSERIVETPRSRSFMPARPRPLLDLQLGAALWRDRRVPGATKLIALSLGLLTVFAFAALGSVAVGLFAGSGPVLSLSVGAAPFALGTLLFGTMALLKMAPESAVTLLRLKRVGVIPLRRSNQS